MARLVRLDELTVASKSTFMKDQMLVYFDRSLAEDRKLAKELRRVCMELTEVIKKREGITEELEVLKGLAVALESISYIVKMSTEYKLNVTINPNVMESDFNSSLEISPHGGKVNVVRRLIGGLLPQGKILKGDILSATERRGTNESSRGNRVMSETNEQNADTSDKGAHETKVRSGPLISGTAYCLSSCSMILLNKVVLSSYSFNAGISLMFYQNLISSIIVIVLGLLRVVSLEKLNWKLVKVWIPVNLIFVAMLVSGMYSLKHINIAMVTILKNVTNILTAVGELYMFRKRQSQKVWTAMFFMIISAVTGGVTDLSFDATGYTWQLVNCFLTASYSLTLRKVMDTAKAYTKSGSLNEVSMVLLNNLLSLPFGAFLIILFDEWTYVINADVVKIPMFWVVATASGILGLAISFTSMWFLNQTGPTTYSLVGSLNKIPISIAGLVLFNVPLSLPNLFSILFGLFAGIFFAKAKMSK
ncbi:sugar phosphate transporter domain-containing protein [Artemisia annua]|uniref:Sugar phosphate transporter domain-containing protein n=1 Tax=Artemisia annua TaxID=35608 RepID=A0A2U1NDG8_ARTAN|nr:sugar phosphate transporter domain-containing protein [Artemisia annua]